MLVCVCIYMYACICYACICMYVYVCMHMYVCMYVCICMCVCMYVCMYVCVYAYMCMYVCITYWVWELSGGKCPTQNRRGNCPGGNCPGELSGGIVQGGIVLHPLRSAAKGELLVPRARLAIMQRRAFSVVGPSAWNDLLLSCVPC